MCTYCFAEPEWTRAPECPCPNHEDGADPHCPRHGETIALEALPESMLTDPELADVALASAIVDWELTENADYWRSRRAARAGQ